jgi:SAM-dependent methyltransferase
MKASSEDVLRLQADRHGLVVTEGFPSLEAYGLFLIHMKAYEAAAAMAAGRAVLDVGCNNGYGTRHLRDHAASIVGVDVSPKAIEDARRRYAHEGIDFHVIDGRTLPFEDGRFDLVTSFQVIEHIADYEPYLSEIRRVLAPGAAAVFTTPNGRIRLEPGMKPLNPFHVREFGADELADLLGRWFADVNVRGLFAEEALYAVEHNRARRDLRLARAWGGVPFRIRRRLPQPVVELLRKAVRAVKGTRPPDASIQERFSTADLFYRDEGLDEALDLMAICRKGES